MVHRLRFTGHLKKLPRYVVVIAVAVGNVGCMTSRDRFVFEPLASWGERSDLGGCPLVPSIRLIPPDPKWLRIHIGMLDSVREESGGFSVPTVFISIYKVEPFFRWSKSREQAIAEIAEIPVRIAASKNHIEVTLQDRSKHRVEVPELFNEFVVVGVDVNGAVEKSINIPLRGIKPQDMVITIPDLFVNSKRIATGAIVFSYKKDSYFVC